MSTALGALFEFLFKYRPLVFAKGDLALGAPWPVLAVLAVGAALAVPAVLSYRRVQGKTTARDRAALTGLRVALLAVLVTCLARPMLLLSEAVPRRNYVGVLLDDSRSMRIADRDGRRRGDFVRDSLVGDQAVVLASLGERFQVRAFAFGGSTSALEPGDTLAFDARESRLADALERARQSLDAVPLSALVVESDGADNARSPMADELVALRGKGIPVFTVGVGVERFSRDIEVSRVDAPRDVLAGSTLVADVQLRQRGYTGTGVSLLVEDDGRVIARRALTLPAGADGVSERIAVRLDTPGSRLLTVRVALQADEQALENARQRPQAATALRGAADSLRSRCTLDRVRASQRFERTAPSEFMGQFESAIGEDINRLQEQMREAGEAAARGEQPAAELLLDRVRQLVRGLESVDDRLRQQQGARQRQQGQQGQQGGQRAGGGGARGGQPPQCAQGGTPNGDPRQIARELQERLGDARALRQDLQRQGVDVAPLDRALDGLRNSANTQSLDDPRASAALQQQVIDQLKAFESALHRTLGAQSPQVLQGRAGEVPARFRAYVEQYYRSLASPKPRVPELP